MNLQGCVVGGSGWEVWSGEMGVSGSPKPRNYHRHDGQCGEKGVGRGTCINAADRSISLERTDLMSGSNITNAYSTRPRQKTLAHPGVDTTSASLLTVHTYVYILASQTLPLTIRSSHSVPTLTSCSGGFLVNKCSFLTTKAALCATNLIDKRVLVFSKCELLSPLRAWFRSVSAIPEATSSITKGHYHTNPC